MNAKLGNFNELENILSVKSDINDGIITLFRRFGLNSQLRHLSLVKVSDVSAVMLIVSFPHQQDKHFWHILGCFNGLLARAKIVFNV